MKGWQYKDILNDIDNLAWGDLSEERYAHLTGVSESPALLSVPQTSKTVSASKENRAKSEMKYVAEKARRK